MHCLLSTLGYTAAKVSTLPRKHSSPLCRALCRGEAMNIFDPINTRTTVYFPSTRHFATLSSFSLVFLLFFQICTHRSTSMAPEKSTPAKQQLSGSTSLAAPPPPKNPHRFVSQEAERIYHESLFNLLFIPKRGFPTSNAFFNFTIQNRG